jgi:hypothetical protein
VAVAATLVVTAASALRAGRLFTRGFDPDEFQHLHGGWCLAHGLWPYRDYFEHHTPWLWLALAPFFAIFDVDRDPERAVAFVLAARGVMWILGSVALVLTFRLGRMWAGPATGWLAAAMLSVTLAFVEKSIEIRPDVPALVCLLGSWVATVSALRRAPEERGARGRLAAAGFLLGAAVLFTQKVAVTLPATLVVLLAWVLDRRQRGARRARVLGLAAFGVGAAVPLVATLALFAAHTGIARFIEFNVTRNAAWRMRFSPVPFLRGIFEANLAVVCLGVLGWVQAATRLPAPDALRQGGALLVLQTLGLLAGAFAIPVPQLHYFLMVLPLGAILAARALAGAGEAAARRRRDPARAAILPAVAILGLAVAAVPPLAAGFNRLDPAHPKVQDQLARMRLVLALTTPRETVMDGFTGAGVFRPHAYFYFFLHDEIRALLEGPEKDALRRALRDGEIAPALVLFDFDVQDFSPEVKLFVEENYEPAGDPLVWRPKRLALDGAGGRGRLDVGQGPTAVLVGRGWDEPEPEGGRWLRRTRSERSTLRVPLLRPADFVVIVHARPEAAGQARLGLAVNGTDCGERPLVAGWSDYAFPVPATVWRAGVNAVRLTHAPSLAVESLRLAPARPVS